MDILEKIKALPLDKQKEVEAMVDSLLLKQEPEIVDMAAVTEKRRKNLDRLKGKIYILRMLGRLLLPALFRGMVNKAQAQQADTAQQNPPHSAKEGTIKVDYIPPGVYKSAIPKTEGEFVRYEEVK